MGNIKAILSRAFIGLFTAFFIYPAILFACLVLGFTSSWKSGLAMLVSALLLLLVMKREAAASKRRGRGWAKRRKKRRLFAPSTRRAGSLPVDRHLGRFPDAFDREASPPNLSEIYYDIATGLKEQEQLLQMLKGQEARANAGHPAGCDCAACTVPAAETQRGTNGKAGDSSNRGTGIEWRPEPPRGTGTEWHPEPPRGTGIEWHPEPPRGTGIEWRPEPPRGTGTEWHPEPPRGTGTEWRPEPQREPLSSSAAYRRPTGETYGAPSKTSK